MQNKQIRLTNLRQLIKREGAVSQLALRLQISPIYIYRVLDGKFNIGDSMARKIEDAYGFPFGWMDAPQGEPESEPEIPTLGAEQRVDPQTDAVGVRGPAQESARPSIKPRPAPMAAAAATDVKPVPDKTSADRPGSPVGSAIPDALNERIVMGIINTLNRILAAHGLEVSDMEKAKLLMKVAEKILDQKKSSSGTDGQKPFLKIS